MNKRHARRPFIRCTVRNRQGYTYGVAFVVENADDEERVNEIRAVLKGLGAPM